VKVAIIGCCKQKAAKPGPAREVYASQHFRVALEWAERFHDRVFIASTKLGLLVPGQEIEPYDHSFSTNSIAKAPTRIADGARRMWGRKVAADLRRRVRLTDELVIVLGKEYWEVITPHLAPIRWSVPFEHDRLASRSAAMRKELAACKSS
jgi:hypothetical protein